MEVVLETPRLILRVPSMDDLDGWAALDADELATLFIGGVKSRAEAREGLSVAIAMWRDKGCSLFSVIERNSDRWVGRLGPWIPDGALGTEIGWAFLTEVHGKGYASEAARMAIDWAFASLGWTDVIHCIDRQNDSSIRLAERLGSRWLRSAIEQDGRHVEVYGQSREEWSHRQKSHEGA